MQAEHQIKPSILVYSRSTETTSLLEALLKIWNFNFDATNNKNELLKNAQIFSPKIILFDLSLALEDDLDTLRRLRQIDGCQSISVFALSGHARYQDLEKTRAAGANEYFVKPVDFDRLGNTVKNFFSVPQQRR